MDMLQEELYGTEQGQDPPITWEHAAEAWERATSLTDTEDGGLTTALFREVICCGGSARGTIHPQV